MRDFEQLEGASIVANDGTHLGLITRNAFDPNSINNKYGQHGSQYSSTSIFNPYGQYGSEFSTNSPFNLFTTTPPRVVLGDRFVGFLTVNEFQVPRIDPNALIEWLES